MSSTEDQILRRVAAALTQVADPRSGDDVVSSGRVRDLRVEGEGTVRFRFFLKPDDPGALVREARAAVERVEGVTRAKIDVTLPAAGAPTGESRPAGLRPGSVPAPTPKPNLLPNVEHVLAVSSGKGGVGKSTIATNLAASLALDGYQVGVLDADIYGPNIPRMFGEFRRPRVTGGKGTEKIEPLQAHGVRLMSLGFLLEEEQPAIMRGPLIAGILKQFMERVEWGPLDFMIVDMPPGTGDAQLSLVQTVDLDGAIMVTTPQDVATGDVLRSIKMFERTNTRVLGLVENMSGFICGGCGEEHDLFGRGGGQRLAQSVQVPLLGEVPLELRVRQSGDAGEPVVISAPDSAASRVLRDIARNVVEAVVPVGV